MNFDEILIETQGVAVSQNEYNRRQVRLVAALLDIANELYQKEAILLGDASSSRQEIAFKEAA
jgi:hypothetical protein